MQRNLPQTMSAGNQIATQQNAASPQNEPPTWRLEVADGPNRGADIALPSGAYRVGAADNNDIVLTDAAMAPQHLAFSLGPSGAAVTALADGVSMRNRPLTAGRAVALSHGCELRIGGTLVRVHAPAAQAARRRAAPAVMAGLAGLVLASAAVAYVASAPAPQDRRAVADVARPQGAADAARLFREKLASLNLDHSVSVTADGSAVLATGALLPRDAQAWHGAQSWFDTQFGRDVALVDKTGAAPAGDLPELAIAAIAMSPVPNILTQDGEHYTVGAVLQGGWSIVSISLHGVVLRRGGRDIEIAA